jgi:DNA-binding NarL/FixJ family response regulator
MIRVLLADDQTLVRSGFRALLDSEDDITVVGEAVDGEQAVALAKETVPDIVLMDIRMPRLDGLGATARITADPRLSGTRVVVLTTFELDEYVFGALRAGAAGFLLKDIETEALLDAVRVVHGGEALLAPRVTRMLIEAFVAREPAVRPATAGPAAGQDRSAGPDSRLVDLTPREIEVLTLVGLGLSNAEIATRLFLSPFTAKTHVSRLFLKLGARDRAQLVVTAYETGLVAAGGDGHPGPRAR